MINKQKGGGSGSFLYGLGFIGAFVYFVLGAPTFTGGILGFLKALVWPIFLVYKLFVFLS